MLEKLIKDLNFKLWVMITLGKFYGLISQYIPVPTIQILLRKNGKQKWVQKCHIFEENIDTSKQYSRSY